MDVVRSVNGVPIRLTDERWEHIVDGHADLRNDRDRILQVVGSPDIVVRARAGALSALSREASGQSFVVVYREMSEEDGFVITAYRTSRNPAIRKEVVWTPPA